MSNHPTAPCLLPLRLLLALACCALAVAPVRAQSTASNATPDAKALAKYDKNGNGKLDPEELAAMQADEAKASKAVAAAPAGTPTSLGDEVVALSPFEVNAADDKGYAASSSMSGTRLNSKLEDIASSISVVTKQQLLDTAAIDINDIFQYEVGTEGTAQFTDPTNDGRGNYDNVQGNPTGASAPTPSRRATRSRAGGPPAAQLTTGVGGRSRRMAPRPADASRSTGSCRLQSRR